MYRNRMHRAVGLVTLMSFWSAFVASAAPLVIYQGDSIVTSVSSNGYAVMACPLLKSTYGVECKIQEACWAGCPDNYTAEPTMVNFQQSILPLKPDVFHYNGGINVINCMSSKTDKDKAVILAYLEDGIHRIYKDYINAVPSGTFIYGEHTKCGECLKGTCNPCYRANEHILLVNAVSRRTAREIGVEYADLYETSAKYSTTDGRHYAAAGAVDIAKSSVAAVAPHIDGSRFKVFFTAPLYDTIVAAGSSLPLKAEIANGTASRVEFYANGTLLGADQSAPYEYTWTNMPAGEHSLVAKAIPASGDAVESIARPVSAWQFPLKVNCGGRSTGDFLGDREYVKGSVYGFRTDLQYSLDSRGLPVWKAGSYAKTAGYFPSGNESVDEVYRTARVGIGAGSNTPYTYTFEVPNGTYFVGLLRIDSWNDKNQYNTSIEGKEIDRWVDLIVEAGGKGKPHYKQHEVVVNDGAIDITIWANATAMISGITISPNGPVSAEMLNPAAQHRAVAKRIVPRTVVDLRNRSVMIEQGNRSFDVRGRPILGNRHGL